MLFTERDSLAYEIETDGVYEDFYKDRDLFDYGNYPKDSKIFDPVNYIKVGKMKDESKGKIVIEFVGLKSKMYSLKHVDGKGNKKGKCDNSVVVENRKHEENLDLLFNKELNMRRIESKLHTIGTYEI